MRLLILTALLTLGTVPARADVPCGGDFAGFVAQMRQQAIAQGHKPATVNRFFAGVREDPAVLRADRAQGIFRSSFTDFARKVISPGRMAAGEIKAREQSATFSAIESRLGVSRGILLAFWGLETDFGAVQGDFNTLNAIMTLAHDCRRPQLFQPQVMAALGLYERGDFNPDRTTGAWAGEIGQVQMLPGDILAHGTDGNGDGQLDLKVSSSDALWSAASLLRSFGWQPNQPWLQEVSVPAALDWSKTGLDHRLPAADWARMGVAPRQGKLAALPAKLILPMGRNGPAFLAYPNFDVLFRWNQSLVYVTTAAYFGTRLSGAPAFDPGSPSPMLDAQSMMSLQRKLAARGYDVGKIDGILGAQTRAAVQQEQIRLGLPADAWPTPELLARLQPG